MKQDIGIYIHIPFCVKNKINKEALIKEYIDALCMEILRNAEILSEYKISTVYFGGGTPSYIDSKYITQISY